MLTTNKTKKMISAAMFGIMALSLVGTSAAVAEASPRIVSDIPYTTDIRSSVGTVEVTQLAARRKKSRRKGYSQGTVTTAAIVGAVVGAIIAKNT